MSMLQTIIRQFLQRDAHPAIQFVKYGICGGLATVTHTIVFALCAWLLLPALNPGDKLVVWLHLPVPEISDAVRARNFFWNNWIAFLPSNLVAYILNRLWVFTPGRHHVLLEIGYFYAVSAVPIAIGVTLMSLLIKHLGFTTSMAYLVELVLAVTINFVMRKFFIFKG